MPTDPRSYGYIRQSRDETIQKNTRAYQRDIIAAAHARDLDGGKTPPWDGDLTADEGIFLDIDESGYHVEFAERPGGRHALRTLRKGDHLYVWKIDRLGRRMFDIIATLNLFKKRGVAVHVADLQGEPINFDSVVGSVVLMAFSIAAEVESYNRSGRMTVWHEHRAKQGLRHSGVGPPHGFRYSYSGGDGHLVPDFVERKIMAEVYLLKRRGYSLRAIARNWNREGRPCPRSKQNKWTGRLLERYYAVYRKHKGEWAKERPPAGGFGTNGHGSL